MSDRRDTGVQNLNFFSKFLFSKMGELPASNFVFFSGKIFQQAKFYGYGQLTFLPSPSAATALLLKYVLILVHHVSTALVSYTPFT